MVDMWRKRGRGKEKTEDNRGKIGRRGKGEGWMKRMEELKVNMEKEREEEGKIKGQ